MDSLFFSFEYLKAEDGFWHDNVYQTIEIYLE